MHAQGDAKRHQERTGALEHAKVVAWDAIVFHLVPMATRTLAHVMLASKPMETSSSALELSTREKENWTFKIHFEYNTFIVIMYLYCCYYVKNKCWDRSSQRWCQSSLISAFYNFLIYLIFLLVMLECW